MFVNLYAEIVVAIKALTVDILALANVSVDILAGLSLSAVATLYANLFLVSSHVESLDGELKNITVHRHQHSSDR